ncbi:hypothetical protein GCM10027057_09770 [Marisediminicola antarctica]|uniref:Tetrahydrofolate dehydrogenase/cyclohydrolase NAD(P)-binding domain-containing protein n=1 Tax=Marisediminicola antarctica TaxID=674079 RepID=A0A7L5AGL5_9MICO|nr:hypothetical protein BHD05_05200 [Marisediminicola antarctica]
MTGYIIQLPLPAGLDENAMLELMDPDKDADRLHPMVLGQLVLGVAGYLSPVPGGVGSMTRAMLLVNVVEAAERLR